jgi:hypothetical protein
MKSSQEFLKEEETREKGKHFRHVEGPTVGSAPRQGNVGKTFIERPQGNRIGSDPSYGNIGSNPKGKF